MSNFESILVEALAPRVAKNINIKDLKGAEIYLSDLIKKQSPQLEIVIKESLIKTKIDNCHYEFKTVLNHLQTLEPVFLTGPAGSGKSTIAEQAAEALGFDFSSISVCAQTTKSDFLGYMDANGRYCKTLFRNIYENGGVFLIDEIDAGNPNVLAVLNAALSGNQFAFPDAVVKKNEKFLLVATANTVGKGSTEYIGRNQLDAATLDRFNFIYIGYDNRLEYTLVPKKHQGTLEKIHKIRSLIENKNMRIIVSTRSIIKIVKLLEIGLDFKESLLSTIFKSSDKDTVDMILSNVGRI